MAHTETQTQTQRHTQRQTQTQTQTQTPTRHRDTDADADSVGRRSHAKANAKQHVHVVGAANASVRRHHHCLTSLHSASSARLHSHSNGLEFQETKLLSQRRSGTGHTRQSSPSDPEFSSRGLLLFLPLSLPQSPAPVFSESTLPPSFLCFPPDPSFPSPSSGPPRSPPGSTRTRLTR
eukprot:3021591-Rhodomonas_salina.1